MLSQRTPEQSISHKRMPTMEEHIAFVDSKPYEVWYFIVWKDVVVGTIYMTKQREIGITIMNEFQRLGLGTDSVRIFRKKHPGKLLANINPANKNSIIFFEKLGFKHIQNTYAL
jgi:RimJ/RimL family protein N-acetyltransferase